MTDQQKVREAFEAWMSRNLIRHTPWDESEHSYMGMMTQRAWESWQAAIDYASSESFESEDGVITDKETCLGITRYWVDGIGWLIPSRDAFKYVKAIADSMDEKDRKMIEEAIKMRSI